MSLTQDLQQMRARSREQAQQNVLRWLGKSYDQDFSGGLKKRQLSADQDSKLVSRSDPRNQGAKDVLTVTESIVNDTVQQIVNRLSQEQATAKNLIPSPLKLNELKKLLSSTPARVGVWRAGTRYLTSILLKLRGDHAIAKDAVYAEIKPEFAAQHGWIALQTLAKDKEEFLLRPDLGRQLSPESLQVVRDRAIKNPHIQITVADGLSAWATEQNAKPMVDELIKLFVAEGMTVGTVFCVKHSRIAIQDVIGEATGAKVSMILLGERPGLGTGDSLSNYMIYGPKVGAVNAKKSMISNIHNSGIKPNEAARLTVSMVKKMFEQGCSGIELKI